MRTSFAKLCFEDIIFSLIKVFRSTISHILGALDAMQVDLFVSDQLLHVEKFRFNVARPRAHSWPISHGSTCTRITKDSALEIEPHLWHHPSGIISCLGDPIKLWFTWWLRRTLYCNSCCVVSTHHLPSLCPRRCLDTAILDLRVPKTCPRLPSAANRFVILWRTARVSSINLGVHTKALPYPWHTVSNGISARAILETWTATIRLIFCTS